MTPTDKELVQKYRDLMMKRIEDNAPYACMLTINFAHPYSDADLLKSMNELVKRLNRAVLGRSARKFHLHGVCSVEVCRDGGRLHGCLHFHFLIKPNHRLNCDNAVDVLLPKVIKIIRELTDHNGRSISNQKLVKVSPYAGVGCLPSYLTKECEERDIDAIGFMGDLTPRGIVGLSIPHDRKRSDLMKETTE